MDVVNREPLNSTLGLGVTTWIKVCVCVWVQRLCSSHAKHQTPSSISENALLESSHFYR